MGREKKTPVCEKAQRTRKQQSCTVFNAATTLKGMACNRIIDSALLFFFFFYFLFQLAFSLQHISTVAVKLASGQVAH